MTDYSKLKLFNEKIREHRENGASEAAWREILHADFSFRGADKKVQGRADFIRSVAARRDSHVLTPVGVIEIYGYDLAIARYRTCRGTLPTVEVSDEVRIFLRSGKKWKLSNWFVEKLPFETVAPKTTKTIKTAKTIKTIETTQVKQATSQPATTPKTSVTRQAKMAFSGNYTPQPRPMTIGLQSIYRGAAVITMLPRDVVQDVLPIGLQLASPTDPTTLLHPVLHLIGHQDAPSTFGIDWLGHDLVYQVGDGYLEMIMLIPYAVRSGDNQWHSFALRMFLDSETAVEGGNSIYGYAKVLGQLDTTTIGNDTAWQISAADSGSVSTYFLDTITTEGAAIPASQADPSLPNPSLPGWAEIMKILSMPVIGSRSNDLNNPGPFICSYWQLDFSAAQLTSISSVHQIKTYFRPEMKAWPLTPLTSAPGGAFAMDGVKWRLQLPPPPCANF